MKSHCLILLKGDDGDVINFIFFYYHMIKYLNKTFNQKH